MSTEVARKQQVWDVILIHNRICYLVVWNRWQNNFNIGNKCCARDILEIKLLIQYVQLYNSRARHVNTIQYSNYCVTNYHSHTSHQRIKPFWNGWLSAKTEITRHTGNSCGVAAWVVLCNCTRVKPSSTAWTWKHPSHNSFNSSCNIFTINHLTYARMSKFEWRRLGGKGYMIYLSIYQFG